MTGRGARATKSAAFAVGLGAMVVAGPSGVAVASLPPLVETARRAAGVYLELDGHVGDRAFIRELARPRWIDHMVAPRETLRHIASRYQVPLAAVVRWNEIEGSEVEVGTELRIFTARDLPPRQRIEVRVQPEDTWWRIAVAHGVDSQDLRAYNWRPGQKLVAGESVQIWVDPIVYGMLKRVNRGRSSAIRPGGISIGSANDGELVNGVQIPERPEYTLMRPSSAYGTSHAVRNFVDALLDFRRRAPNYQGRVVVRTMSRPRGGQLGSHRSHQTGRDVDINLPLKASVPQSLPPIPPSRVDWEATYQLVRSFAATGEVVCIFLDYRLQRRLVKAAKKLGATAEELDRLVQWPRGSGSRVGLVRHSHGHDDHIHVRFTCGPSEPECVQLLDGDDGD